MLDSIRTARLLVRRWRPEDAVQLKEAIDVSLPELQAWVPWAMGVWTLLRHGDERPRAGLHP